MLIKAQKMQRLAEMLLELQQTLEQEGGEPTRVERGLDEVARRVGVDLEVVRLADPATLVQVMAPGGRGDPGKCWAVAEVLFLDGLLAVARGRAAEAELRFEKARRLYGMVGGGAQLPEGAPTPEERLEEMKELMEEEG